MRRLLHKKRTKTIIDYLSIAGIVLSLDQLTKFLVQKYIVFGSSYFEPHRVTIFENFLYFVHIGNEGAAWGLFADYKQLLMILAFIVLAFIYIFRKQLELEFYNIQIAFGLLIGGILGNLTDRMRVGHVIDYRYTPSDKHSECNSSMEGGLAF